MSVFDDQLIRLKQALGLPEDQDVAAALGMTKAAFSARKTRASFPVDKVKALAADKPELRLDVNYILTGISDELERRLSALGEATRVSGYARGKGAKRAVQEETYNLLLNTISSDEQRLIHCFRRADARGQALLLATAVTLAGDDLAPSPGPTAKAAVQQNFLGKVGQSAAGNIINKGRKKR